MKHLFNSLIHGEDVKAVPKKGWGPRDLTFLVKNSPWLYKTPQYGHSSHLLLS